MKTMMEMEAALTAMEHLDARTSGVDYLIGFTAAIEWVLERRVIDDEISTTN